MGGEKGTGPQGLAVGAVFQHRLGQALPVKGGGAPADLIQDEEALGGGLPQDLRDLAHLHHEGGAAAGEVVAGADAGEDPVHQADPGGGGRDEGAHLGHQHDEGHLAHVGGLARHVGAGDDGDAVFRRAHEGVVGDEEGVGEHLLYHRVAAAVDLDDPGLVHLRAAVAVPDSDFREGAEGVQLRHGGGAGLDAGGLGGHLLAELGEELILQGGGPVGGGEDGVLQFLQLLGDVALAVHQGLLADVVRRDLLPEGVGDLDVVAEDLVVPDFQGADAGLLLLPLLQLREEALAAGEDVPELVQLGVVAVPDEAPLPDGEGRLVAEGLGDAARHILQGVDGLPQLREPPVGEGRHLRPDAREPLHGGAEGGQVPAPGAAVDHPAQDALHIAEALQGGHQLAPGHGILREALHRGGAPGNGGDGAQWPLQPGAEHPPAHGGLGLVQHPEEAPPLLPALQGLRQH